MTKTLDVILPYLEGHPDDYRMRMREEIFKAITKVSATSGMFIDTPEVLSAFTDILAHLAAHGDGARSSTAARKVGEEWGKDLRIKMLKWRQDIEAGVLAPLPGMGAPPPKKSAH